MKCIGCLLLCGIGVWAQQGAVPKVTVNVEGLSALVAGDVLFEVSGSEHRLVEGIPFQAAVAQKSLEGWSPPPFRGGKYLVWYHLRLSKPGTRQETLLIGDRVDRFFLRIFHARTQRVVEVCDDQPMRTEVSQTTGRIGNDYVIEVFLTTTLHCPTISYSNL